MKVVRLLPLLMTTAWTALADGLPVITAHPQSYTTAPGSPGDLSVVAPNATAFQWRFNGVDIPGATSSSISHLPAPSYEHGLLHGSGEKRCWLGAEPDGIRCGRGHARALCRSPITGMPLPRYLCIRRLLAAARWSSQVQNWIRCSRLCGTPPPPTSVATAFVNNGYFLHGSVQVPSVSPGQTVYYRVDITYTNGSETITLPSRVLTLVAGGASTPFPRQAISDSLVTSNGLILFPLGGAQHSDKPGASSRRDVQSIQRLLCLLRFRPPAVPVAEGRRQYPGRNEFYHYLGLFSLRRRVPAVLNDYQCASGGRRKL